MTVTCDSAERVLFTFTFSDGTSQSVQCGGSSTPPTTPQPSSPPTTVVTQPRVTIPVSVRR